MQSFFWPDVLPSNTRDDDKRRASRCLVVSFLYHILMLIIFMLSKLTRCSLTFCASDLYRLAAGEQYSVVRRCVPTTMSVLKYKYPEEKALRMNEAEIL